MKIATYTEGAMSGRVLGLCTILRKVRSGKNAAAWLCRCGRCGAEFESTTNRITSGAAAKNGCGKCGEMKRDDPHPRLPPISYGGLISLERGK